MPDSQLAGVRLKADTLDPLLGWMLSSGHQIELSELANAPRNVTASIWYAPFEGTCVEGTHAVCGHRYLLIATGYGEGMGPHTFDLGYLGVLVPRGWQAAESSSSPPWVARLLVDVVNYPEQVFRSTHGVVRVERHYELLIDTLEGKVSIRQVN